MLLEGGPYGLDLRMYWIGILTCIGVVIVGVCWCLFVFCFCFLLFFFVCFFNP